MFERNKIDNVDQSAVPVEVTLGSGEVLRGRLMVAIGRSLADLLNSQGGFVEFEAYGGERMFLAKAGLLGVKPMNVPRASTLAARYRDGDGFDPHAILGVPTEAPIEAIKAAWHRLSKLYHPDRYAGIELPKEVCDYLGAMARRINAAYAALEAPHQTTKRAAMHRAPAYAPAASA